MRRDSPELTKLTCLFIRTPEDTALFVFRCWRSMHPREQLEMMPHVPSPGTDVCMCRCVHVA